MYKNQLGDAIKEVEHQEELHKKYNVEDKNVKIVEKNNMAKFLIKTGILLIKVTASILLVTLASIGLTALYYEQTRSELIKIFLMVINK